MKAKKVAALLAAGALARPGQRAGAHQPSPQHDPRGSVRDARRARPRRAGRRLRRRRSTCCSRRASPASTTKTSPAGATKVIETKLATPIKEDGETIDTEVSQIVWTWTGPLGKVNNGQFINFPLSLAIPQNAAGKALEFRTVQTYSNGQVVHWIDPSLTAEHPSPRINVTAKGGVIEDVAGDEAGPEAGRRPRSQSTPRQRRRSRSRRSGASKGLGIAALILGALGLIAGSPRSSPHVARRPHRPELSSHPELLQQLQPHLAARGKAGHRVHPAPGEPRPRRRSWRRAATLHLDAREDSPRRCPAIFVYHQAAGPGRVVTDKAGAGVGAVGTSTARAFNPASRALASV